MSPPTSPLNPSQTVERIREIIVGRHLERLELRVARLESGWAPSSPTLPGLEDLVLMNEARMEALKENVHRMVESSREHTEIRLSQHREETHRLAAQIQQIAAMKSIAPMPTEDAVGALERKVGGWLTGWQNSFHSHLDEREARLSGQLRQEVAALWENTESHLTRLESRAVDRDSVEERFSRIALAARALAECASPSSTVSPSPRS